MAKIGHLLHASFSKLQLIEYCADHADVPHFFTTAFEQLERSSMMFSPTTGLLRKLHRALSDPAQEPDAAAVRAAAQPGHGHA